MSLVVVALLSACTAKPEPGTGDDTGGGDTGTTEGPQPAALAELSSGECPDLSASGTSTFTSSGEDRKVTVILPSSPGEDMPVYFFFSGIADASTHDYSGQTAEGLGLQDLADEQGSVWVVPEPPVQNLFNMYEVYLWDIARESDHDLVLFDDLRTCIAQQLSVDLKRVSTIGFSGGALFNTVVLGNRADSLATAVELSGGSDLDVPGYDVPLAPYTTPATDLPVLLTTGADGEDVWPGGGMTVVNFFTASNHLQNELLTDQHFAVRCTDDKGHVLSNADWNLAVDWAAAHRFGEASPYATGDLGGDADWCTVAEQVEE
jgi:poly(3-hydroxybutyrate) depolymerase